MKLRTEESTTESIVKIVGAAIVGASLAVLVFVLYSIPVYMLWNWVMPEVFGVGKITFPLAIGITALSGFLIRAGSSGNSSSK